MVKGYTRKRGKMMYQCIKQFGSIKTGSFWDVDRYIVNSDGERRRVIITNEEKSLLLSMTEFENHFAKANKPLTEQEYKTNDKGRPGNVQRLFEKRQE